MGRKQRVAIIGAGIGGLTAARALHLRGHDVHVFDRAAELGEVGAGIQVGPNAVKALYHLGLKEAVERIACAPESFVTYRWKDATPVHIEPYQESFRQFGAPYFTAHRSDLHQLLLQGAKGCRIKTSSACASVSTHEKNAVAVFADGSEFECDALIGADGIHSAVRASLWGADKPRYTNYMGWRGVLPMEVALEAIGREHAELHRRNVVLWRSPTGTMLFYPLRAGELMNVFAGHYTQAWAEESWTLPSTHTEVFKAFDTWPADRLKIIECIPQVYKWAIFDRDPIAQWTKGRVSLLGDAAHPMMPTLAQGAAIAIEDAFSVAYHLDAAGEAEIALDRYERERIERATQVQLLARAQFEDNLKSPPPKPRDRNWIFAHDVTARPSPAAA